MCQGPLFVQKVKENWKLGSKKSDQRSAEDGFTMGALGRLTNGPTNVL